MSRICLQSFVMVVAAMLVAGNLWAADDAAEKKPGAEKRKALQEKMAKMAEQQFKKLDKDGDGKLTVDEFKGRRKTEVAAELFKLLDKNGDDGVCIEEFKKKSPEFRFKTMDKDGDGELTFDEYKGRRTKPEDIEQAEQRFKKADKDGDKKVSCEEFMAAAKKPTRKPARKGGRKKAKKATE
ncbi:MAG: EF-hand domain-containing protein [Planctomycetes bacterium]|nr:EF-hand domain-containing protein [Planctomycetota bacterium]MBL7041575.1 EF-hand domain-containing protein [Pirellulaceae bacterium]